MDGAFALIKERLGCLLYEYWRLLLILQFPSVARMFGLVWQDVRNRGERLEFDSRTGGRRCVWSDSSTLTVTRIFPHTGTRLLEHVLQEWSLAAVNPQRNAVRSAVPQVSIVVPVGGAERHMQFFLALQAARAQTGVVCEIVVVEQSVLQTLDGVIPADVVYIHQAIDSERGFNKSKALNAAARMAKGDCLLLVDADFLLPVEFAAECARVLNCAEAVRPCRLIFNLDEASTMALSGGKSSIAHVAIESVVANAPMPIAVRRSTYWEIGGHDESYYGWGGEDTEFLDRLRTRDISEGGWMPVLHAWHPAAAKKVSGDRNQELHAEKMATPAWRRVERLVESGMGTKGCARRLRDV